MNIPLSPCVPENLVSRDGFSRPVPRQPAHLHTQAESGAYLRDSSRVPRRRPMKPPYAIGSVPSLPGHAIAYRWRSLPRVRRHRACKPQGSSERVLPWQITMDQLIFASLSHTHYWYEVGMVKVPACRVVWLLSTTEDYRPVPRGDYRPPITVQYRGGCLPRQTLPRRKIVTEESPEQSIQRRTQARPISISLRSDRRLAPGVLNAVFSG